MEAKHTPGPWVVFGDEHSAMAVMPAMRRGDICVFDDCMSPWEREGNARLIAKSPELLERLQAIIDWADYALSNPAEFDSHGVRNLDGPVFDAARELLAAISSATASPAGKGMGDV